MANAVKIAVIGGDARQGAAAERLASAGYEVYVWGIPLVPEHVVICRVPEDAISQCDVLLLPIPLSRDQLQVNGTDFPLSTLLTLLRAGMQLFCGKPDADFIREATLRGAMITDYSQDEVYMLRNAQPTAEGAVAIAMRELRRTLFGSHALVVGYGRIGKLLSDLLLHMGADVTVTARKPTDLALAQLRGSRVHPLVWNDREAMYQLPPPTSQMHVIFNTVPVKLIDETVLKALHRDTVLIDLASAPGGIDYDTAHRMGLKTVVALSLPGKVAPVTAGEIIGDYILSQLSKGGIS